VSARGGNAIPVQCDHGVDEEIYRLFDRIEKDYGRIDLLVNNAFKGNNRAIF
jgi:dehydrogenase/reductase SDR family protein 1